MNFLITALRSRDGSHASSVATWWTTVRFLIYTTDCLMPHRSQTGSSTGFDSPAVSLTDSAAGH
jgi:hypothetical protein